MLPAISRTLSAFSDGFSLAFLLPAFILDLYALYRSQAAANIVIVLANILVRYMSGFGDLRGSAAVVGPHFQRGHG